MGYFDIFVKILLRLDIYIDGESVCVEILMFGARPRPLPPKPWNLRPNLRPNIVHFHPLRLPSTKYYRHDHQDHNDNLCHIHNEIS